MDKYILNPIYLLLTILLIIVVLLFEVFGFKKKNITNIIFTFSLFILDLSLGGLYFIEKVHKNIIYRYIYLGVSTLTFFYLFISLIIILISILNEYKISKRINSSLNNSPWRSILILDRKLKVKKISNDLLKTTGLELKDIIKKPLEDVLNKSIRIIKINGELINNKNTLLKLSNFILEIEKNKAYNYEIEYYDYDGTITVYQVILQASFNLNKFKGLILIGQLKSDFDMLGVEKQAKELGSELDIIKEQYVATINVLGEGLSFLMLKSNQRWINNILKESLSLGMNNILNDDFLKCIHPEDLIKYKNEVNSLNKEKTNLEISYRMFKDGIYLWYHEKIIYIHSENRPMLVSSINPVKTDHFMKTGILALDRLKGEDDLIITLNNLIKENRFFNLCLVKAQNLEEINKEHGRSFGNLILGEYVKKMFYSFADNEKEVFRVTGSTFAIVMKNREKITMLRRGSHQNDKYLNMKMTLGAINSELKVYAGITENQTDGYSGKELLKKSFDALGVALNSKYKGQVFYYRDGK